jgi:hypothetical protein
MWKRMEGRNENSSSSSSFFEKNYFLRKPPKIKRTKRPQHSLQFSSITAKKGFHAEERMRLVRLCQMGCFLNQSR